MKPLARRIAQLEAARRCQPSPSELERLRLQNAWNRATFALMDDAELQALGEALRFLEDAGVPVPDAVMTMWENYSNSPSVAAERDAYLRCVEELP